VLYKILDRSWQEKTRAMRGAYRGRKCFIVAGGPSANRIDYQKVRSEVSRGAMVMGVNNFAGTELAKIIRPDFIVVSDPNYLNDFLDPHKKGRLAGEHTEHMTNIDQAQPLTVFMPHTWKEQVVAHDVFQRHERRYFFHCENIAGKPNGCDLLKPRYYLAMTAYIGVSIAAYLGFDELYLIGFDEDYIRDLRVNIRNELICQDRHFYPLSEKRISVNRTSVSGQDLEAFCLNVVNCCISQKKLFTDASALGTKIFNCNPDSYVTGFPKTDAYLSAAELRSPDSRPRPSSQD
jgi:hypothetical protein